MEAVKEPYTSNDFTLVVEVPTWICDNCGASGYSRNHIQHYISCKPGEAQWWIDHPEMY